VAHGRGQEKVDMAQWGWAKLGREWMWLNWDGRGQQPGMEVAHYGWARPVARNGYMAQWGWVKLHCSKRQRKFSPTWIFPVSIMN
jgi:hypothetical protein